MKFLYCFNLSAVFEKYIFNYERKCFCHKLTVVALKYLAVPSIMEQRAFQNVKQLFEYQHLLLLRDIWWSKF